MAKIVVTSDANFIRIAFNTIAAYSVKRKERIVDWSGLNCLAGGQGVELDFTSGKNLILKSADVETIDGVAVTDDSDLYNKLDVIM